MEFKTNVQAEAGQQDLIITREFELPVELLFKAYTEARFVSQWMGTSVLKLESRSHGSYQFETKDKNGHVVFRANGAIHNLVPNKQIVRTFEMENTGFGVQLEIYEFESLDANRSQLTMHVIYESCAGRDKVLQLPFKQGINMAHNRLQEIMTSTN